MFERFLGELKRRNVIRVAAVYTVTAWGVFQVANTIFQTLGFPKWTSPLLLVVLVLGLPITMVIAWAFERAPDGAVVRTEEPDAEAPKLKLARMDVLLLAGMVLVLGVSAAQITGLVGGGRATILGGGTPEKSVAVLPFATFSAAPDSEYFADGLTEEVINSLAQVPDLKVAGRTSSFYFKGKNEDLREVGKRLGVAHVVEGSVRRDGERLRVTAQLVSVKTGFHLWSKTYDRRMDDAFAIQSEIGAAVTEALKTELSLRPAPSKGRDRDPAAYQLQITSRAHLRRQGLEDLQAARAGFERLMALEPDNASAYAGYAQATMTLAQNHLAMDFSEAQKISEAAIDKAVKLDPDSGEVWLARAVIERVLSIRIGGAQYEDAFDQAVRKAVALEPRNPEALALLATRLNDSGKSAEAVTAARKSLAVDPLNRLSLMVLGKALLRVGELDEAQKQFRTVTELYPDFAEGKYQLAMLLVEQGRLDQAEPWLKSVAAEGKDPFIAFQAAWVYENLGMTQDADDIVRAIKGSPGKELGEAGLYASHGDWAGMLAYGKAMEAKDNEPFWPMVVFQGAAMTGRNDEALAALKRVRPDLLTKDPSVTPLDLNLPILLAHVLGKQGNKAQADLLLDRVLAATASVAGRRTPNDWRIARVKVFAARGQNSQALAELEAAVNAGWRAPFLFDDSLDIEDVPAMAGLRGDSKFKALLARVRADLATQRAAVLASRR